MKISQLLGRQNERTIYARVSQQQKELERERNLAQIRMIREYRAEQRARKAEQDRISRMNPFQLWVERNGVRRYEQVS